MVETSIAAHFSKLTDPRIHRTRLHSLHEILVITICAAICGADNWAHVELFGRSKESWFRSFLDLPNGIPSHDTFGRVFAALDHEQFRQCFIDWAASIAQISQEEIVAVDGKAIRRSFDAASGRAPIHMVNAWAASTGIALGQLATDSKSNEITAIPKLLELLSIRGCIVTIDAMGCQKAIAEQIVNQGGDYVLALKGNQGTLHDEVIKYFEWALKGGPDVPPMHYTETVDGDHGRIETRRHWIANDVEWCAELGWKGLSSIAMLESERTVGDKTSMERRYYISSLQDERSQSIPHAVRAHWGVENQLHWVLDVAFREDDSRARTGNAAENLATIRQIALNLLKQEKSLKVGVAGKRLKAGWDESYLLKLLGI
jgi:predicted transposase YbfD/YdcC